MNTTIPIVVVRIILAVAIVILLVVIPLLHMLTGLNLGFH
jgi:hypothetical protein